ncbi:MAG: hypothetical protein F4X64_01205 [Chloroflexi bacterium]|nr:hypothetical protein [Chloroflexota bacterium]
MGTNGRMIAGELGELARPLVDCSLSLPRLGVYAEIIFLVDTGADATYLHPAAGSGIGVPSDLLQRRVTSRGIGGNATYFPEPGYPVVRRPRSTARLRYGYRIDINVARLGDVSDRIPSLLGYDVIRRWRMDHDPTNSRLAFTVRDADFTMAVA